MIGSAALGRRAASTVAVLMLLLSAGWAIGCGESGESTGADAKSTDSPGSGQVRADLAGRTVNEIAKSPAGECDGRSERGKASVGDAPLLEVSFSCKSSHGSRLLGVRLVGLELEDGKIAGADEIQGFLDFFATGERRPNASCSFVEGEVDCEPVPGVGALGWADGSRFSVALAVEEPCEAELVAAAEVQGPRAALVSAAGRIAPPTSCEQSE